ncbi:MAG: hypothetical protein Kilf2KO_29930 [Rhodospirillales bacterium]
MSVSEEDWVVLNAHADGELTAGEAANLKRRLRREPDLAADLARIEALKSSLTRLHPTAVTPPTESAAHRRRWPWALAASLLLALGLGVLGYRLAATEPTQSARLDLPEVAAQGAPAEGLEAVGVETGGTIGALEPPDLSASNLKLIAVTLRAEGKGESLTMDYRGPRGCRVRLVARPLESAPPPVAAELHSGWRTARAGFTLTADGMDRERFAGIASYAKAQIRLAEEQETLRVALVETTATAAPCV